MARFFMAIGVLIMLGTGGCAIWGTSMLNSLGYAGSGLSHFMLAAAIATIPFVIGLLIFNAAKHNKQ